MLKRKLRLYLAIEYGKVLAEYNFWSKQVRMLNRDEDAIVAAEYYGQMCALVNTEREILGENVIAKEFEKVEFNLMRLY